MTKIDTEMNVWIIFCRCEGGDNTYVSHCIRGWSRVSMVTVDGRKIHDNVGVKLQELDSSLTRKDSNNLKWARKDSW